MSDLPPPIMGAGLAGGSASRGSPAPLIQPIGYEEDGTPIYAQEPAQGASIPGSCLRVLSSPLAQGYGGECPYDCPGRQEDGGCLVDIVRWANENGLEWSFDVRITESGPLWVYTGPERED